ncbi:nuclear transport factor 2 family protein [Mycobacterium sp. UM_CSW]|uniref:nuclear transport factor 2 family protein n=1 Tax=Mycobacterium sp. UM_CSW TaxID=1370119 RepID=UPI0004228097|nr:nuclear transport factor 2 family protein [Mycobacterium sp. UM_CSW]
MTEIDDLAARLRHLEDEREISRLIASYGPAVDAGDADAAAQLWATNGTYDVEGWHMDSRNDVHAMVDSASHQNLVANGCCHFIGPSVVTVTEDSAVAVAESLVLVRDGESYRVWRSTANHFELQRIEGRWRIIKRTSRVLNGDPGARALLTAGLAGAAAPALGAGPT